MFTVVAPAVVSYYLQLHSMMLGFYRVIFAANKAKLFFMGQSLNAKS